MGDKNPFSLDAIEPGGEADEKGEKEIKRDLTRSQEQRIQSCRERKHGLGEAAGEWTRV